MTFLRWAGSKKQLLGVLTSCWHAANCARRRTRYVEAFSGSAALFFSIKPPSALLVDVNEELQHCFKRVQLSPREVGKALQNYGCTEANYYDVRQLEPANMGVNERAARFIYLNRFCFNGLYRTNRQGKFNVPFGGVRNGTLPSQEQLAVASRCLRSAEVVRGDFYETIAPRARAGDFVYMDPPYAKRNVDLDNQYGPDVFGTEDIERLSTLATLIDKRGGHFLISYADCPEIRSIAKKWTSHRVSVNRTIAANAAHRQTAEELLITNI